VAIIYAWFIVLLGDNCTGKCPETILDLQPTQSVANLLFANLQFIRLPRLFEWFLF